jgi:signal peptidase II
LKLEPLHSPAAIGRFVLTTLIGLGIDLWTKSLAAAHLAGGHGLRFIPGWLHFEYTENRGAVFGIAQGQRWLFVIVSIGAILFLSWLFAASRRRQWFYQILLGMLLAGVLGNMYDRVVYGYVRDMILMLPGWHWSGSWTLPIVGYPGVTRDIFPWIFNIADSLLCVGVGLMIVYNFFQPVGKGEDVKHEDVKT